MKKELMVKGAPKIPKAVQDRLMEKMMDKNDDRIIEKIQQRNAHMEAVHRLTKEIEELCSINVIE